MPKPVTRIIRLGALSSAVSAIKQATLLVPISSAATAPRRIETAAASAELVMFYRTGHERFSRLDRGGATRKFYP